MATYTIKADTLADGASLGKTSPRKFARDSNGNLFAVYHRNDGTRNQIYISKSGDGGENWAEYKVTDDAEAHESPSVAIDSDNYIYIICIAIAGYNTYDIWQIVKSTNGGESWGNPADINPTENDHSLPVIAVDSSDYIHIACIKVYPLYDGIIYTKSEDGGSNWDANTSIAGANYLNQKQVAIAIDSNDYIHLAFIGAYGAIPSALRYRKYTDSWQTIENLASEAQAKYYPTIAIDGNDYIHISWATSIGVYFHINYIKYTDSWQALEVLTTGNYNHYYPTISVDDDNEIYVVFYGFHAGSTTYRQIGYNHYTDSWQGVSWLTSGTTQNRFPNAIFARWAIDGSAKVNIPDTGFAFIWAEDDDIKIYLSADLTWQSGLVIHEISGIIAGQSSTTASLSGGTIEIAGIINSISSITGTLITDFSIAGQVNGVSSTIGNLEFVTIFISGTINGISSITVNLGIAYSVQGQINAISSIISVLGIVHTIQGQIDSISSISASLYGGSVLLNGQIDANATIISNLSGTYLVQGQIDGVSDLATAALINLGLIDTTQVRILDRDENLKKIVDVISLKETFRLSKERHISLSLKELPDNFACGWYIYTVLPTESNWLDCSKWRVERYNISNDSGGISYDIHAEHYSCELLDEAKTLELTTSSATNAITQALSGTTWSVGTINTPDNYDLKIDKKTSVLDILQRIATRWKGELYFRNDRKVDLKTEIGSNNNLWFRYDKNIKDIRVSHNSQDVITRLYLYGQNDLNISSVNDGKEYLDSIYIDDYPRPKIGTVETQHSNAADLKAYGENYLSNVESPIITYELSIVDLSFLTKYLYEKFKIGDTVTVHDDNLNLRVSTRIKEIRRDYCYPENSSVVLANELKLLSDWFKEIQDQISPLPITDEDLYPTRPAELPIVPVIYVGGNLRTGIYQGAVIWMHTSCTAKEIMVYIKWIPIAGNVVVGLAHNGIRVGTVTIPQGTYVAPGEGEVGAGATLDVDFSLVPFDRLNIDIDAIVDSDGDGNGIIVEVRSVK